MSEANERREGKTRSARPDSRSLLFSLMIGKLTVPIDRIYDWDQESIFAAYALVGNGKARGKVIVRIGA